MTFSQLFAQQQRNLVGVDADVVVQALTRRQYIDPHKPLREVLRETIDELHCCPAAVDRAMDWLQLEWDQPVGRIRRTELIQLARVIHRFWNQTEAERLEGQSHHQADPQPAPAQPAQPS